MDKKCFPVIIIGCGPAGAAASLFLSKAGIAHLILEKEAFPRDKVCGDGCSGKTVAVLNKLSPDFMPGLIAEKDKFLSSHGVIFAAPNGRRLAIPYLSGKKEALPPGFTVKRKVLDHYLFSKLQGPYARIIQNAVVQEIKKDKEGFSITFSTKEKSQASSLNCKILLGADGDKGVSRKCLLNRGMVSKTAFIGLRAYYDGISGMHPDHYIELHFLKETLPGYFWIFPLPGGKANVGIAMDSGQVRKNKINLRETMLRIIAESTGIKERFTGAQPEGNIKGWGLPMSIKQTQVSGDHFMLLGDAAALIDPFTGEGIGNALFSGMLAAEAAEAALNEGKFDADFIREHYDFLLFRAIEKELKLSYTLQKLVRHSGLFNFIINKACKSPTLQKTFSSMLVDLDMRDYLRKPSFYWKILTNR